MNKELIGVRNNFEFYWLPTLKVVEVKNINDGTVFIMTPDDLEVLMYCYQARRKFGPNSEDKV